MHTNLLIHESSPYLLQHAHNPVNWFPWCEKAFALAKEENKPILISIGYAACHWCHVMEKESFEDEKTAAYMNQHFINIKIDREERPDLDNIYMDAVQAITGSGGWPLNVFLTSDKKPFYGGTYFPAVKMYNRLSWMDVLQNIVHAFHTKNHEIENQAEELTKHLHNSTHQLIANTISDTNLFTEENTNIITKNILKQADTVWGGFGNAPKFPQTFSIQYLLRQYYFTKNEEALKHALLSLDKMIYGGIYDQLSGGFARYSTDIKWFAPHFEKMLYDNALLIDVLCEAYQLTQNQLYKETIVQTLAFIENDMLDVNGGFYCALDADSEGEEGKFYTWSKKEIEKILQNQAEDFCHFFNVTEKGNWEQTNILWIQQPLEQFAANNKLAVNHFKEVLQQCTIKLLTHRNKRVKPELDDKILLGWNALMIKAYCKAYAATNIEKYKQIAVQQMNFLQKKLHIEDRWYHTYKNGVAKIPAFLDDYAYLIQAFIHLQEITADEQYLVWAKQIVTNVIQHFSHETGLFSYTHQSQKDIIIRKIDMYDGALPSANATMAINLHYLSIIFNNKEWQTLSEKMITIMGEIVIKYPTSFGNWASLIQQNTFTTKEIVLTGNTIHQSLPLVLNKYIPNKILQSSNKENSHFPLLKDKFIAEKDVFYLCTNYGCESPFYDVRKFLAKI
ncbi:MAG: thioredoxin domain-containing protein [Chitinophagaceae bacterium]|nr:thioredoxin domain-containing protein [Chitinophagaceae bacterium]MCW5903969.1 thioredoxin domain-containing protein [Chitinophagaceae bacterium]